MLPKLTTKGQFEETPQQRLNESIKGTVVNGLHLCSALLAPLYIGLSFTRSFTHSYTNGGFCLARLLPPHWEQFMVTFLHVLWGSTGNETFNLNMPHGFYHNL